MCVCACAATLRIWQDALLHQPTLLVRLPKTQAGLAKLGSPHGKSCKLQGFYLQFERGICLAGCCCRRSLHYWVLPGGYFDNLCRACHRPVCQKKLISEYSTRGIRDVIWPGDADLADAWGSANKSLINQRVEFFHWHTCRSKSTRADSSWVNQLGLFC